MSTVRDRGSPSRRQPGSSPRSEPRKSPKSLTEGSGIAGTIAQRPERTTKGKTVCKEGKSRLVELTLGTPPD